MTNFVWGGGAILCRGNNVEKSVCVIISFLKESFKKIAKFDYQLFFCFSCLSVRPHGTAGFPLEGFFQKFF